MLARSLQRRLDAVDMTPDPVANDVKQGFPDCSFNVVLDKGLFDSVLCGNDGDKNIRKALHEIDRILVPDGIYLFMTYNAPDVVIKL